MAMPEAQRDSIEAGGIPSETTLLTDLSQQANVGGRGPRDEFYWLNRTFYIIGAIAGIGFLAVLFGAYAVPEIWVNQQGTTIVVVGTIVMTLAVIAWIIAAVVMISMMIKRLIGRT